MTSFAEKPTLITLKAEIQPGNKNSFVDWQAKFNSKTVLAPGFVSLEFLAPTGQEKQWLIVQRFSNEHSADEWRNSSTYQELISELKKYAIKDTLSEVATDESKAQCGVTQIFVAKLNPERKQDYLEWSAKIHQAEAHFPGFRGVYMQSPQKETEGHWITLLQFDSLDNLDRWLESPERQALLGEAQGLISSLETNRVISPYIGWFASIAKVGEIPPVWKQTMIVLLVLFPIVMMEIKYLSPIISDLNLSLGTFIGNAISVTLVSFPMMPIAIWFLGWWLVPTNRYNRKQTIFGTLIVCLLYVAEIILLWRLKN